MSQKNRYKKKLFQLDRRKRLKRPISVVIFGITFIFLPAINYISTAFTQNIPFIYWDMILEKHNILELLLILSAIPAGIGILSVKRWGYTFLLIFTPAFIIYKFSFFILDASVYNLNTVFQGVFGIISLILFTSTDISAPYLNKFRKGWRHQLRPPINTAIFINGKKFNTYNLSEKNACLKWIDCTLKIGREVNVSMTINRNNYQLKAGIVRINKKGVGIAFRDLREETKNNLYKDLKILEKRNREKIIIRGRLFLAFLLIGLLSFGCLGILDSVSGINVENIKKRGKLIAITSYGANSYFIYKGNPMGFEYELLTLLAREFGVKLELHVTKDIDNIINMLSSGEGDLVASNIAVTKSRTEEFEFTDHFISTRQVLVQSKYDLQSNKHNILIRNPIDLIGKEIHVRKESRYYSRLINLSEEIGGDIKIINVPGDVITEELIKQVAKGKTGYTISDEPTALINQLYYPNIDVSTPISFPQRIAWVVRRKSPELLSAVNAWIAKIKRNGTLDGIYNKYYRKSRTVEERLKSKFHSLSGGKISPYDEILKKSSQTIDWDWILLVSLMYQESRFNPKARSWAGATGLMQLMPSTARTLGVKNMYNPTQNINGSVRHINSLLKIWGRKIKDKAERVKFVLASYNAGTGHIQDARKLAKKYKKSPDIWYGHVDIYVKKLSNPKYYNDSVVEYGYCRGDEPYNYVKQILERYKEYQKFVKK